MPEITRVLRSKQQARSTYNRLSSWYDLLSGGFEDKPRNNAIQNLEIKEGEIVMDIGCGTGKSMPVMAENVGETGKVIGVDLSEGMLAKTKKRLQSSPLESTIHLVAGDGMLLPFRNGTIDKILFSFSLELFDTPDIPAVLAECKRVLNLGGLISVVSLSKNDPNLMTKMYEWIHTKSPQWVDCRPIFVRDSLERAGFNILSANEFSMMGLKGESVLAKSF